MLEYKTYSTDETCEAGIKLGKIIKPGDVVALFGGLGAGKTAFTGGLVKGLGIDVQVYSPTYAIVNEYKGNYQTVYHYDMYRINGWDDLYSTGYFDNVDTDAVLVIEWSENIENALPENSIYVSIEKTDNENERIIRIGRGENIEDIGC